MLFDFKYKTDANETVATSNATGNETNLASFSENSNKYDLSNSEYFVLIWVVSMLLEEFRQVSKLDTRYKKKEDFC
jgi:hypothetical protein